jgi:hypothetical protein
MTATTFGQFYVTTDEVGKRIAGYTVRHRGNTYLCATMDGRRRRNDRLP